MTSDGGSFVVVGVDGSELSTQAVAWADRYAHQSGAALRLVIAWQWPAIYGAPLMSWEGYDPEADARAVAQKAQSDVALPATRVELVVREGAVGPALVSASEGALALVVGSRGHNPVSNVLLGSASAYCVHHATCPVVVVR